ncbi:MAG: ComEC family competence protein [Planctomycetota bacterium]|nr:MAG: ComEC family competence protein [Planctomycetota bacterium]
MPLPEASPKPKPAARVRQPALAAAACFGVGIALDRTGMIPMSFWIGGALGGLVLGLMTGVSLGAWRTRGMWLATVWMLLVAGGARHHQFWSQRSTASLAAMPVTGSPVRLEGVLATPVSTRKNNRPGVPAWLRVDQSVFEVDAERLISHTGSAVPVTGRVRVSVTGHVLDLRAGDRLRILGFLAMPNPPDYPGEFDYPAFLRAQGIDRVLRADHPDTVSLRERPAGWGARLSRIRDQVRREASQLFFDHIPSPVRPVAESLLLGDRTDMREATTEAFIRSGTMHILAISGMHVAALAGFVMFLCRLAPLRSTTTACVVAMVILGYAGLVENRPPVLRAVVLGMLTLLASVSGRRSYGLQALSLSALILLLRNPSDLFDVGAQLSFVAVAAIIVTTQWLARRQHESYVDQVLAGEQRWWGPVLTRCGRWLAAGYLITAIVWLVTAPILMRTFHLVSPAGLLVNALLTPLSTLVLGCGYLFLGVGLLCPPIAGWVALPFSVSLQLFVSLVEWVATWPASSSDSPAPSAVWMLGFYFCLLGSLLIQTDRGRRWAGRGALLWTAGWLLAGLWPVAPASGLTCTVLDVGHGGAILIECPNGRTLLYDCGSMGQGRNAAEAVLTQLWSRHRPQIDALVISHADHDHYNGGIELASRARVGTTFFSPQAIDFSQEELEQLFSTLAQSGGELKVVMAGDRIALDPEVEIEVLHPPADHTARLDNAHSVVLRVTYVGKSILLTGDLEQEGLKRVLSLPPRPVDLLLAPHHGGRSANPPELARWAQPQRVFVSNQTDIHDRMAEIYFRSRDVYTTAREGTLTFTVSPDGELRFQSSQSRMP